MSGCAAVGCATIGPVSISVVIADDQEMVRTGMRTMLQSQLDIEVVGEAADGKEALEAVRRLQPDVLLVDIRMPQMDGLEVLRRIRGTAGQERTRVVVVTTFDLDEYVYPALRSGAAGFVLKRSGPTLLVEAVRAAVAGDSMISPSITVRLLRNLTPTSSSAREPLEALTTREREIAGQVAEGKTNIDIANELFISPGTVKTHVANIQRKLGVRNRVGIAVSAWELGYARQGSAG